ncbi:MAG TPA: hypothetical protein DD400_04930 [Rhodospirillaceae bacterium]|nr:hypothetical protein [Rhodospirillaceae bacterium]
MINAIRQSLGKKFDLKLVEELLASYREAKENFYIGGLRLSAVEGGRFCEAAFRLLEQATTQKFTPLNKNLDTERLIITLSNIASGTHSDSVRLYIPRCLRTVYDIRNNRNTAHLADGIDPNMQDASLVISVIDWVMAEFVRLYNKTTADEAKAIINNIVTKRAPTVQGFSGFLKVLRPELKASSYVLLLLYERSATYSELESWVRPTMRRNLRRTLSNLVDSCAFAHYDREKYIITQLGCAEIEKKKLHCIEG